MQPLIDGDLLVYEIGFGSQTIEGGEVIPRSWAFCQNLLEERIRTICLGAEATEEPLIFLTASPYINKLLNKTRQRNEEKQVRYEDNFRNKVAVTQVYKGNRKSEKPFHYKNLINHIIGSYDIRIMENGIEADDGLCIEQFSRLDKADTIICSRDKDLRTVPGWHFQWELGEQPSWGPHYVDELGFLEKKMKSVKDPKTKEIKEVWKGIRGTGHKFFYAQMIMGDLADNIPGIPGKGYAFAYKLLHDATSVRQCYELVAEKYVQAFGDEWETKFNEMANLLWMVRELDEEGKPVMWKVPDA